MCKKSLLTNEFLDRQKEEYKKLRDEIIKFDKDVGR